MRRAIWLWDKDTVAKALAENDLEGEVPENFTGLDLLLGATRYSGPVLERSLTAADWDQTNAMLERVARMWLEDQAASGSPFIIPEGAPRDGAVYLWGPRRVASFFAHDCPNLSASPPQGLVGTRLLMQRYDMSEDDRTTVTDALGRIGLAFMRDFVRWQGQMAAVSGVNGSLSRGEEPDMKRALWMWTEDHVLRELEAMGSPLEGSRTSAEPLTGAAALLGTTRLEGEDAAKIEFLKVRVAREWLEDQAASRCPFRPAAAELESGLAYLWDADETRIFLEAQQASGRFLGDVSQLPPDLTGRQLVAGEHDLPEEDREALRGALAASAMEFMRDYLESGAAEADAAAAARTALAQQPVSPDRARARKMRRAMWRWDSAQVFEAISENDLDGQVPDGSTGRELLNDGPWTEDVEEVLQRVALLWLEDQAVLDVPYMLPAEAPVAHAVYLWDSRQVAAFFMSDEFRKANLQGEAPTWISGRQLLKQQHNLSADDREKVSDGLGRIGLRFMRELQRWLEAEDPVFYGSLVPGMRRMMLRWNEVTVAEALGDLELDGDVQNAEAFHGPRFLLFEELGLPDAFSSEDLDKIRQLRLRIAGLFLRDQMLLDRGMRADIMLSRQSPLEWTVADLERVVDDQRQNGLAFDESDVLNVAGLTVPQILAGDHKLSERGYKILRHIVDSACLRLQQTAAVALEPQGYNWSESALGVRLVAAIQAREGEPSADPMSWAVWRWCPGEASQRLGVVGVPDEESGRALLRGEHEAFQPALRRAALQWLEDQAISSSPFDVPSEVAPRPVYLWGASEVEQLFASAHELSSAVQARRIQMPPRGLSGRQLLRRLYSMPRGDEDVVLETISRNGLQFMKAMDVWEVSRNIGNICHLAGNNLQPASERAADDKVAWKENPSDAVKFAGPDEAEAPLTTAAPVLDADATAVEENPLVEVPPAAADLAPDAKADPFVQAPEPLATEAKVPQVADVEVSGPRLDATAVVAHSVAPSVAPLSPAGPEASTPLTCHGEQEPENTKTSCSMPGRRSEGKAEQAVVKHVYSEGEMTPEIADTVKDQFKRYDKNGDGMISYTEFCNVMRACGEFTDKELNDMFKNVDTSGDGNVSYEEFIDWVMTPDSDSDSDENEE